MIRFFLYCVAFPLLFMVFSCSQNDDFAPVDLNYDYSYYPLKEGTFVVYDVREVLYPAGADSIIKIYQERYRIGDTLNGSNTTGNTIMWTLEKYTRANATADWSFDSVWTVRYSTGKATLVVTENNIPVDKMAFPMKEGLKWNGNSQNVTNNSSTTSSQISKSTDAFTLKNYRKPYSVSDTTFSNTVTVIESNTETLVSRDIRNEVYAKDIGMIYRLIQNYTYKSIDGFPIGGDIAFGRNKEWKYYSHGIETE